MEVFDLDAITTAILLGMVAGVTGALVGMLISVNPLIGAVVGLAASGYITIAQNIGHDAIM